MRESPKFEKSFDVEGGSFQNAGNVSGQIKSILKDLGVSTDIVRRVAIICYESEINIVSYAKKGTITLAVTDNAVKIETKDEGPGIPDIDLAMKEGYSTATAAVREMGFGAGHGAGEHEEILRPPHHHLRGGCRDLREDDGDEFPETSSPRSAPGDALRREVQKLGGRPRPGQMPERMIIADETLVRELNLKVPAPREASSGTSRGVRGGSPSPT